ncbi:MAG: right-handed parallel beta-helix repeat-containing protein [Chloroflexi bacterium]|nr:right-handed parallel beta-helix repeat-containing protein [Chloroflexota bacterium]
MYGVRILRLIAILLVLCLPGFVTPGLAAEDLIELSAGCTLYDAIIAANSDAESGSCPAGRGADTIRLTADITLVRELPPIVSTISIEGAGYSISGHDAHRIFHVESEGTLTIRDITLTRGFAKRGGAILNHGVLNIFSSQLNDNNATHGGAIYNAGGALTVETSSLDGNKVEGNAEGAGGAIFNRGDAMVRHSLITQSWAVFGAIYNGGDMTIRSSTLAANEGFYSGAIENRGWLTIEQSDIKANDSHQNAGISSDGPTSRLVVTNSTISGNRSDLYGGGLTAHGTAILTHVTIIDNESGEGAGIYRFERNGGLVILRNSIVAGNIGGDCTAGLHEQTNSIIGDGSCDAWMGGDPKLELVEGRYEPLAGSPALAAGDPRYCASVDQFGSERPTAEPCDIGAVESTHAAPDVSPARRARARPEPCTLAHQIIAANTDAPYRACPAGDGADIIVYKGALPEEPLPAITSDITIVGNGGTIQPVGRDAFPLFEVLGGHLRLRNLTLRGGYSPWTGGMIAVLKGKLTLEGVTIRDSSAVIGGAIFNDHGEVTIVDSRFINNRAIDTGSWDSGDGGAIYNSGVLRIHNSFFSANEAMSGGAISNRGEEARAEITGSKFASNTVTALGGALSSRNGSMRIDRGLFVHNFARGLKRYPTNPGMGGAIFSMDEIQIRNSTFIGNGAGFGGALYFDHPQATLEHLTIVQNRGSGVYALDHSVKGAFKMFNSLIAGNGGEECWVSEYIPVIVMRGNLIEDGSCDPALQADPLLPAFDAMRSIHALQAGSPAIDAGDSEYCLPYDQLGTARPVGGGCDIGAIEHIPVEV